MSKKFNTQTIERIKGRPDIKRKLIDGLWYDKNSIYRLIRENKPDGPLTSNIISQVIAEMLNVDQSTMFEHIEELAEA